MTGMFSAFWHGVFFDPIYNSLVLFIDLVRNGDVGLAIGGEGLRGLGMELPEQEPDLRAALAREIAEKCPELVIEGLMAIPPPLVSHGEARFYEDGWADRLWRRMLPPEARIDVASALLARHLPANLGGDPP